MARAGGGPLTVCWRLADKRIGESEQHGQTNTDQESGIDQTDEQEHARLEDVHEFGLASGGLKKLAPHDADANAGANGTQSDNDTASKGYECDVGHENSLVKITV